MQETAPENQGGFPRDRLIPYFKWKRCFNPCRIHRRTSGRSPSRCLHDTWNGLPERVLSVPENRPERYDRQNRAGTCADRLIAGSLLLGAEAWSVKNGSKIYGRDGLTKGKAPFLGIFHFFFSRLSPPFGTWHMPVHPFGFPATSSLWHLKQA